jgi:aspartyl/asparaginyl beta-hydroxylase (cupin superfamily)
MTKTEQLQFIKDLVSNTDDIRDEYLNFNRRTIPLPDWEGNIVEGWNGIALWWNYSPWPHSQKRCPLTTKLVTDGPSHRTTGWLLLKPNSRVPTHNHKEWGHKIIVHLPMVIPEGDSGFYVDGKYYKWKYGEIFAFDGNSDHSGYNNTDEIRSVFVLDFDYDEWYDTLREYMVLNVH